MQLPAQITFRDIEPSEFVEARIREKVAKLEEFHDRITSCRVVVEARHHHHHKGRLYSVRVDVAVPGGEIVVNREAQLDHAHEDVYVAIRDAFKAVQRQLQDHVRRQRGEVKAHEAPAHGHIARIFPEQGYGFIETADGDEVYFHRNAVINDGFDGLNVGAEVRYDLLPGEGEKGPQASTVHPTGKHHIIE